MTLFEAFFEEASFLLKTILLKNVSFFYGEELINEYLYIIYCFN